VSASNNSSMVKQVSTCSTNKMITISSKTLMYHLKHVLITSVSLTFHMGRLHIILPLFGRFV